MRQLNLIIKDYLITIRWLKDEIKKDIKDFFSHILNAETYINAAKNYFNAIKNVFTLPTYGLYWAMSLFVFSLLYANLFWQILFGLLIPIAYIHSKLATGEPIRDYKKKYW